MNNLIKWYKYFGIAVFLFSLSGCSNSISLFSEQAYQQDITLKVESLALMNKAVEPYKSHEKEVTELNKNLDEAYEYAKGRPENDITTRQWEIMISPDHHLLGGFLKRWKDNTSLSPFFIKEARDQVSKAFDTIIELESGKMKPGEVK
jgi:hypothetical protein